MAQSNMGPLEKETGHTLCLCAGGLCFLMPCQVGDSSTSGSQGDQLCLLRSGVPNAYLYCLFFF